MEDYGMRPWWRYTGRGVYTGYFGSRKKGSDKYGSNNAVVGITDRAGAVYADAADPLSSVHSKCMAIIRYQISYLSAAYVGGGKPISDSG